MTEGREYRVEPVTDKIPHALYRAEQVRSLDRCAIETYGIPGLDLMERAGVAAFSLLRTMWPDARNITVVCGIGNNGGDGYVVARLAHEGGFEVRVLQLGDPQRLQGDALTCAQRYISAGGAVEPFQGIPGGSELLVDAVLGTGLERAVSGSWGEALATINRHPAPVLAIDIPSGLNSDTGLILGVAVDADVTISFIGLKQGMFTADGPACCGDIQFHGLDVPAAVYDREIISARRLDWEWFMGQLVPRQRTAHKGHFGHLLVVGGDQGFMGAARLAAEAGARAGAGLVSVATHPDHASQIAQARPELMAHGVTDAADLDILLQRASVIAVGPGLGQGVWSRQMWQGVLESELPLVVDADALNLLSKSPINRDNWILTPHPGEASRLLRCTTMEIHQDRFKAVEALQQRYGGVALLKGAGTLVKGSGNRPLSLIDQGNPGMASGGMGDLLTGIIASLLGQIGSEPDQEQLEEVASKGAALHAAAGDLAAAAGERGLLASDLLPFIRTLNNSE